MKGEVLYKTCCDSDSAACRQTGSTLFFLSVQRHQNRAELIPQLWYLLPCCGCCCSSLPVSFIKGLHMDAIFKPSHNMRPFIPSLWFGNAIQQVQLFSTWTWKYWVSESCKFPNTWCYCETRLTSQSGQLHSLFLGSFFFFFKDDKCSEWHCCMHFIAF